MRRNLFIVLFLIGYIIGCLFSFKSCASDVLVSPAKLYPSNIKTPQDIEDWLIKEGFKYTPDKTRKDEWKPPEQTIKDMSGDCEDVAILACYILEDLGYVDTMIIAIYGKDLKHGICWFREREGTWSFFSTGAGLDNKPKYYWPYKVHNAFNILYGYFPEWEKINLCTPDGYSIYQVNRKDLERRQP